MSRSISTLYCPTTKYKRRHHPAPMTKLQVKQGISDGTIPSAISDTSATLTAGALHDPFHSTTKPSTKVFLLPTGGTAQATHNSQLMLNIRAPANQVDIVPNLTQTLLSGSKFADAGYTAVCDKDEVNFYDSSKIHSNSTSILQEEIRALLASSSTREQHTILNVYELPSIEHTIRYLHAAAVFPTKTTWMAAIRLGNYDTWPLVTIANVHKHFPQSEEMQQAHMRSQRQGVRSTKATLQAPATPPSHTAPSLPHHDIYIKTYDTRNTVYTDQTDALIAAAANLAHVIKHNAKAQHVGAKNLQDLQRLQQLFSDAAKQPPLPPTPTTPITAHAPPPKVQPHKQIPTAWPRPATSPVISDDEDSDDEMAPPPRVPTRRPIPFLPCPQPTTTPPALNTHSRTRSLTHETMLHFLATRHIGITAAQATQRRYPPDMLHAVLNDETVGGNRINFPGDCGTPTADMITVKILLNSVISTANAKFMTIDIKDFYLNTPMERPEYMRLKLADIPDAIIDLYHLRDIAQDGYVFVRIQKGMYGLPQAGIIAQQLLEQRLQANGYHQSKINPGFWSHDWRPICFALCVDDFGVKYVGKEHATHLISTLKGHYGISTDWEGCRYIGLTLHWDYRKCTVRLSMPGYCEKAGQRFHHPQPTKPQHQPYPRVPHTYGSKQQLCTTADTASALGKHQKPFVQEVTGVFLYYARAVDCTMLTALGSLATQQANPTTTTLDRVYQFLDYALPHPNAGVTYPASDMILAAHGDASYLSETNTHSRAGGHFFLSKNDHYPNNNGAVLTIAQIIKAVMSSTAEAKLGALYINSREGIPLRHLLVKMGHPQPPTPIQTDNSTALGVVNNTIQPKRTKAMDMRFHWLRCCINQKHFRPYWRAGATNLADYVTKHHPAIHHQAVRPLFLTTEQPTLPNSKLTAPCIPRNTLLRPPISRPAAIAT
eukprot:CCRYP_010123-RA/>CCRYP_010123-RA protein AED:0.17 eAED:0.14 QI:0/0/0/1/1/1/4/0/941